MKTRLTLFLVTLAVSMAGPAAADRDGVCPMGPGVCYSPDCQAVAGQCDPKKGNNPSADFVGYDGTDGSYAVSATCSNGKDLSNVIVEDADGSIKYEAGIDKLPTVEFLNGELYQPNTIIKKCGDQCIWYGYRGGITCNPHN